MITATLTIYNKASVDIQFISLEQPTSVVSEFRVRTKDNGTHFIGSSPVNQPFKVVVAADQIPVIESAINDGAFGLQWPVEQGYSIVCDRVWVLDEHGLEPGTYLLWPIEVRLAFPNEIAR